MASDQQLLHKSGDNGPPIVGEPLPKRKTCTGYYIYKVLTIVYAIFYVLIGLLLLALGVWVSIIKKDYESINDIVSSPAILCILVGSIILISAIIGCVGASIDRLWPLRIFLGIVIIVFVLQVVIGILAYVYREEAIENVGDRLGVTIERYHLDSKIGFAVDRIQTKGKCCGFKNYNDWDSNSIFQCNTNRQESCGVPESCCREVQPGCGFNGIRKSSSISDKINNRGCKDALLHWIENHLDILGATALGLAILHILGIFIVYMLITKVEDRIRLFKYRKRFYPS